MHVAPDLESLHAPYAPLLRAALLQAGPPGAALALDLACGPGLKSDWLAAGLQPGGRLVGIDCDRAALQAARARQPPLACVWAGGDALALPLRAGCVDCCWCIAALDLLSDPAAALHEMRRVLRAGGGLVVTRTTQLWVRPRAWPAALAAALAAAPPLAPADGLGDDLRALLATAGFGALRVQALLLAEPIAVHPHLAALPLADWDALRPLVAPRLGAATLARCDAVAAETIEPEPATVLLIATGAMIHDA